MRILALIASFILAAPSFGQTPAEAPVSATITFANGESITVGSNSDQMFPPIETLSSETVGVQLQLPPTFVNTPVGIASLDGGLVPDTIQVTMDGTAVFVFHAGGQPGLYRVILNTATTNTVLQFLVPNAGTP